MHRYLVWAMLIFVMVTLPTQADEPTPYRYAYIDDIDLGIANLYLINPHHPEDEPVIRPIEITRGFWTVKTYPSPNGESIAIVSKDKYGYQQLSIYRMAEQESEEVVYYLKGEPTWSPDSQYLVANAYLPGEGPHSNIVQTYVYSLETKQRTSIYESVSGVPSLTQERIFFSPTNQLLLTSTFCQNQFCDVQFDLIESWNQTPEIITSLKFEQLGTADQICAIHWSPDARYFSFVYSCEFWSSEYYSEIFIVDVIESTLTQLTHNTNSFDANENDSPLTEYFVDYGHLWLDSTNMLLSEALSPHSLRSSGRVGIKHNDFKRATTLYTENIKLTEIDHEVRYEFAVNPVSGEIAYRLENFVSDDEGFLVYDNPHIELATYQNEAFEVQTVAPVGCDLNWSPDGEFLAFIDVGEPSGWDIACVYGFISIYFINQNTHELSQHVLPEPPQIVGWVKVND